VTDAQDRHVLFISYSKSMALEWSSQMWQTPPPKEIIRSFQLPCIVVVHPFCSNKIMWHRSEPADWDRKWSDVTGSQWSRQSLSAHLKAPIPADGGSGGTEHLGDHLGKEESCTCLLPLVAQIENPPHGWGEWCRWPQCFYYVHSSVLHDL